MKSLFKNKIVLAILFAVIGLFAGWLIFGGTKEAAKEHVHEETTQQGEATVWTCSMHPQIRQNEPGACPICGMDLIPVEEMSSSSTVFEMSENAVQVGNIQTSPVMLTQPEKEVFMQGKVEVDERNIALITARFPGRIEKLYIDFTGAKVSKGQKLASIYSPELINAQKELFEAIKYKSNNPQLYNAARNKLKLWNLTDQQIDAIEKGGEPQTVIDVLSPLTGIVTERNATLGEYVKEGTVLFKVADLSRVWVVFDAYEMDLPWLKEGNKVDFTVSSLPGEKFASKISFIDPLLDPKTRAADVRTEVRNPGMHLKPGMFTDGTVKAQLPIDQPQITVPKSAIMWTGKRSVAYVSVPETEKPTFEFREVTLGVDLGSSYVIKEGLEKGEKVVTYGTFKVDAAAQLAGKTSMMNRPDDAKGDMAGHQHGETLEGEPVTFTVYGNCSMCKARIEKAAKSVEGVHAADWNTDSKILNLHLDNEKTSKEKVSKAIAKVGHNTEFDEAPDSVYEDLPKCCLYREK